MGYITLQSLENIDNYRLLRIFSCVYSTFPHFCFRIFAFFFRFFLGFHQKFRNLSFDRSVMNCYRKFQVGQANFTSSRGAFSVCPFKSWKSLDRHFTTLGKISPFGPQIGRGESIDLFISMFAFLRGGRCPTPSMIQSSESMKQTMNYLFTSNDPTPLYLETASAKVRETVNFLRVTRPNGSGVAARLHEDRKLFNRYVEVLKWLTAKYGIWKTEPDAEELAKLLAWEEQELPVCRGSFREGRLDDVIEEALARNRTAQP
jgi:hypothetical protein